MLLKRKSLDKQIERRFRDALHVAIGLLGRLLPDTEEVVRATNLNVEGMQEELPEELRDPFVILDRD